MDLLLLVFAGRQGEVDTGHYNSEVQFRVACDDVRGDRPAADGALMHRDI
jgi:hypothetical protein